MMARTASVVLALVLLSGLGGCKGRGGKPVQYGYVNVPFVSLRDRVAAVYNKVGALKNGEGAQILETSGNKRYVRVRSPRGEEGWMEARYLVDQQTYDGFQKLAQQYSSAPSQAAATARREVNLHLEPNRDSDHLYILPENDRLQVLKRATTVKPSPVLPIAATAAQPSAPPSQPPMEDWWLVRDAGGRAGWVLSRMVDLDVPLDVAQYSEGQRIAAFFVLNQVQDGDKKVPQYLVLLTEPKEGASFDFNQARVFTWNLGRHRYETAYRERNLFGVLPATVGREDFGGKEGTLPVFTLRLLGEGGARDVKYKLNGVMVRRVLAPGEPPPPRKRATTGHGTKPAKKKHD